MDTVAPNTTIVMNLEIEVRQRELLDQAAARTGLTPSDFVIDAACREAEDIILDQLYFPLETPPFAEFEQLLADPPEPGRRLSYLLASKAPWE